MSIVSPHRTESRRAVSRLARQPKWRDKVASAKHCCYEDLLGVNVQRVMSDLSNGTPPSDLLQALRAHDDKYLQPCTKDANMPGPRNRKVTLGRLAIISYKTVRAADGFTLSPEAFVAAMECANAMHVTYVWLDVRKPALDPCASGWPPFSRVPRSISLSAVLGLPRSTAVGDVRPQCVRAHACNSDGAS
jgi:hypothetical protein